MIGEACGSVTDSNTIEIIGMDQPSQNEGEELFKTTRKQYYWILKFRERKERYP